MVIVGCVFHPRWQQVALFDAATGRRKLGRESDWALSHPADRCKRRAGALGKPKNGFPLSHRRRRLDVRIKHHG